MKFYTVVFAVILSIFSSLSHAQQSGAPSYLAYQSFIFDESGDPIADGEISATVQITDDAGAVLYEEKQTPNAIHGQISMVIGSGVDSNGAVTGGVPFDIFNLGLPRYVTVVVEGLPPFTAMEVTSIPYSIFAQRANSVADGSITYESLNEQLISRLNEEFSKGYQNSNFATKTDIIEMYKSSDFAKQSAVKPNFVYSASGNVQNVLEDLDRAVKMRDDKINIEEKLRVSKDNELGRLTEMETVARTAAVTNEINLRASKDDELDKAVLAETTARNTAITNETSLRSSKDEELGRAIATETAARTAAVTNEINLRVSKDDELGRSVAAETVARGSAIASETGARIDADATEVAYRQQRDVDLGARVDGISNILASERDTSVADSLANKILQTTGRVDAESNRLTNEATRLNDLLGTETTLRQSHRHISSEDGSSLAFDESTGNGAIYVGGGHLQGSNFVQIPGSYSVDECKILPSIGKIYNSLAITGICLYTCPVDGGFTAHCGYSLEYSNQPLRCPGEAERCVSGGGIGIATCDVNYLLICVKKY